eukprot:Gregarina_sp_Pseudo_9__4153@NODE_42_length_5251_cov_42_105526_g39_i0_p1_GENE_NODE_42_length_5251_cov_42_105526_g39_i0NODE_42_length_5251_cov_42_105526_g39_i0_p1_ORF_typecomplete_len1118_score192_54Glyco_transf_20/PF00982_21/1_4e167Trehalose_PPase/PF02358_16/2_7e21Glycos_transf_1/PF00534_20/1_1e09Glyco_trans_1_4/PF13692_6/0_0041_NODE_42_length_5251_cov_42_105526_g39_i0633416
MATKSEGNDECLAYQRSSSQRTKVLVVANRLPVTVKVINDGKDFTVTTSSGGLVSALRGVHGMDFLWMGWPGSEVPENLQEAVLKKCQEDKTYPVYLDGKTIDYFYNGFCNNILWPLFHYVPPPMDFGSVDTPEEELAYYIKANGVFTDAICAACALYPEDDQPYVWVHDYHLMMVPQLLRHRKPHLKIGWFLHTPWPTHEVFRMLPFRTEILTGLLSANLLAFHVYDYQRHFMESCRNLLGLETVGGDIDATPIGGGIVKCTSIPIGIEPLQFVEKIREEAVRNHVAKLQKQYGDRKVILGVDRLDYMKGIPHKLNAFDRFLELYPEWNGKCVLVQLAVPSRSVVVEYQRLKSSVHEIVGKINGRRGHLGFIPVHYLDQSLNFTELVALYRVADVAFITSLRDGMNLVAFEYVAAQKGKYGVLVLSEFAGAAQSLGAGAVRVNPWNLDQTAAALNEALTMSNDERRTRHDYCFRHVLGHTSQGWAESFLEALFEACEEGEEVRAKVPPVLNKDWFVRRFVHSSSKLLLVELLDCMVASKGQRGLAMKRFKSLVQVPAEVLMALRVLASDLKTVLVLSSAASAAVMDKLFGDIHAILIANKGCSFRDLKGEWIDLVREEDLIDNQEWALELTRLVEWAQRRTPGSYVEKTTASVSWYWDDMAQIEVGQQHARELLVHLWAGPLSRVPQGSVEVNLGSRSVEIRTAACGREKLMRRILEYIVRDHETPFEFTTIFGTYKAADEVIYSLIEEVALTDDFDSLLNNPIPGDKRLSSKTRSARQLAAALSNQNAASVAGTADLSHRSSSSLASPTNYVSEAPRSKTSFDSIEQVRRRSLSESGDRFCSVTVSSSLSRARFRLPNVEAVQQILIHLSVALTTAGYDDFAPSDEGLPSPEQAPPLAKEPVITIPNQQADTYRENVSSSAESVEDLNRTRHDIFTERVDSQLSQGHSQRHSTIQHHTHIPTHSQQETPTRQEEDTKHKSCDAPAAQVDAAAQPKQFRDEGATHACTPLSMSTWGLMSPTPTSSPKHFTFERSGDFEANIENYLKRFQVTNPKEAVLWPPSVVLTNEDSKLRTIDSFPNICNSPGSSAGSDVGSAQPIHSFRLTSPDPRSPDNQF